MHAHTHAHRFIAVNSYYYHLAVILSGTQLWNDSVVGSHDMEGTDGTHW